MCLQSLIVFLLDCEYSHSDNLLYPIAIIYYTVTYSAAAPGIETPTVSQNLPTLIAFNRLPEYSDSFHQPANKGGRPTAKSLAQEIQRRNSVYLSTCNAVSRFILND